MRKRIGKFQSGFAALTWVLGIQFLLFPFYYFHLDYVHNHSNQLSPHRHHGHFHSVKLEVPAHPAHSHEHQSVADHRHSHHPGSQDKNRLNVELNKETLKPPKPFKVLKVAASFSAVTFHHRPQTSFLLHRLNVFTEPAFLHQLRERSPPFLSV